MLAFVSRAHDETAPTKHTHTHTNRVERTASLGFFARAAAVISSFWTSCWALQVSCRVQGRKQQRIANTNEMATATSLRGECAQINNRHKDESGSEGSRYIGNHEVGQRQQLYPGPGEEEQHNMNLQLVRPLKKIDETGELHATPSGFHSSGQKRRREQHGLTTCGP